MLSPSVPNQPAFKMALKQIIPLSIVSNTTILSQSFSTFSIYHYFIVSIFYQVLAVLLQSACAVPTHSGPPQPQHFQGHPGSPHQFHSTGAANQHQSAGGSHGANAHGPNSFGINAGPIGKISFDPNSKNRNSFGLDANVESKIIGATRTGIESVYDAGSNALGYVGNAVSSLLSSNPPSSGTMQHENVSQDPYYAPQMQGNRGYQQHDQQSGYDQPQQMHYNMNGSPVQGQQSSQFHHQGTPNQHYTPGSHPNQMQWQGAAHTPFQQHQASPPHPQQYSMPGQHGYAQPGYAQAGYAQVGYAHAQPDYAQPGYAQPGHAQRGASMIGGKFQYD